MYDEILISGAYLQSLAANARVAADMMRQGSDFTDLEFSPNHEITDAYRRLTGNWSECRGELQQGLDAVSQAFAATYEAFMNADSQLAAAVAVSDGGDTP